MRLGTANTYSNTLDILTERHSALSAMQQQLTSGKKVAVPSDDPVGASQAERALTRIERVKIEQRALAAQRDTLGQIESTLGSATATLQRFRELVVQAGSGALAGTDRTSIVQEMLSLRDQLLAIANTTDVNGQPVFSGLGSNGVPFIDNAANVTFKGIKGQTPAAGVSVPLVMDGDAAFGNIPKDNGTFNITGQKTAQGQIWTDLGQLTNAATFVPGQDYTVTFTTAVNGSITYDVNTVPVTAPIVSAQPFVTGQTISFTDPLDPTHTFSFAANGVPKTGDTLTIGSSPLARPAAQTKANLFEVLDTIIAGTNGAASSKPGLTQTIQDGLGQIDSGLNRIGSARTQAGAWLNRADAISGMQDARSIQLEGERSRAEDLDMIKGISDFQNQQTGYDAALKTYAQVQRLSLFNYIS